jgi:anti-anti-sigma regulatory factor
MNAPDATLKIDALGATGILHVIGYVDASSAGKLQAAIERMGSTFAGDIFVALGECLHVDEKALQVLRRSAQRLGFRLRIVAPPGALVRSLLTGFTLYDGFEEAFRTRAAGAALRDGVRGGAALHAP